MSAQMTPTLLYLDTCIPSAAIRGQFSSSDSEAFTRIADAARAGQVGLCASTVMQEEFQKIPGQYQGPYLEAYSALSQIRGSNITWIDDNPASTGYLSVQTDALYSGLRSLLKDEPDARHLFHAKRAGINDVLTIDQQTILSQATELRVRFGINVWTPSEFARQLSTGGAA